MQDTRLRWSEPFTRTPWATLLPLWVLLPLLLSGAVRYTFSVSLEKGLGVCGVVTALLCGLAYRFGLPKLTAASAPFGALGTLVTTLVLVAVTYRLWWSPKFYGMPNTVIGVDVGNHVLLYTRFSELDPKQYEGFVSLYALMHWYRRIIGFGLPKSAGVYQALRFSHYALLLAVPVALGLVAYVSLARLRTLAEQVVALVLSLPVQVAVLGVLVFPALQYYQAEGFYSQIAGIFPFLMCWVSYGLFEQGSARVIVCCFWLVVQRFTYGLNLGDLLLTLGYLFIWDSSAVRIAILRWGSRLFVPVAFAVSYVIFEKLWPLRYMQGWFHDHDVAWVTGTQLVLSLGLLASVGVLSYAGISVSDAARRLWRFAGTLGFVNAALTALYFAHEEPLKYYILKYSLYAMVLVFLASTGPIISVVAALVESRGRWLLGLESARLVIGLSLFGALCTYGNLHGYRVYKAMAKERYERPETNSVLHSHYEPEVDAFIERTLRKQGKPFGGYYDPLWARMFNINALHWVFSEPPDHIFNRAFERGDQMFVEKPGHCYFYLAEPPVYHGGGGTPMQLQITQWSTRKTGCTKINPAWGTSQMSVCSACF